MWESLDLMRGPSNPVRRGGHRAAGPDRQITPLEATAVLMVIAAVVAMAIWFVFFSSGGIGPGTV